MAQEDVLPPAYLAAVEPLPEAALLYDRDVLVHVNPEAVDWLRAAGVLGDDGDLSRVDLAALVAVEDRPALLAAMREAGKGRGTRSTRLVFEDPSGGRLVAACVFSPLLLDGRSYVQVLARDVTARADAEAAVVRSEAQFRAVFDHSPVGVALVEQAHFVLVNPAMCRILGRTSDDLIGRSADEVTAPEDVPLNRALTAQLDRGGVAQVLKRYARPDGTLVWGELTAVRISEDGRRVTLVHLRDVTAERQAADDLRRMALHDPMTGLGNRTLLEERLHSVLAARDRTGGVALLFLDLDGFKKINDALGHGVGDRVLKAVGRRLRDAVRPSDTVIRWGGDEFVVLLDGLTGQDEVLAVVRRVERAVAAPIEHRDDELLVTASVGIACAWPGESATPAGLLHDADVAMYQAKDTGRNRHSVFDEALRSAAARRSHVEQLLRRAADGEGVVLHYQPLVELATRRVVGAEALLRLQDDDGRLLYPESFLDVAEDTGLMVAVERVVLEQACRWAAGLAEQGWPLTISVNVCAKTLERVEEFEQTVGQTLARTGLPPRQLVCELTEHSMLDTGERTIAGMCRLRELGVEFSVDDFGAGYASMSYLDVLPLSEVKLDRKYVVRAAGGGSAAAIVRAVAGLARELGIRSVAEGIEDEEAHALAQRLGAGFGQGYLYSRPVPQDAFAVLLSSSRTRRDSPGAA